MRAAFSHNLRLFTVRHSTHTHTPPMLPVLRSAWARSPRPLCLVRATASRPASTNTKLSKYVLKRPNPLAIQLAKTGIWTVTDRPGVGRPRKLKNEKEDRDGDGEKPKRKRGRPKKEETEPIEEETVEIKEEIKEEPIVEDIFQDDSIRSKPKPGPRKRGDKYRVNITDEKLCGTWAWVPPQTSNTLY